MRILWLRRYEDKVLSRNLVEEKSRSHSKARATRDRVDAMMSLARHFSRVLVLGVVATIPPTCSAAEDQKRETAAVDEAVFPETATPPGDGRSSATVGSGGSRHVPSTTPLRPDG